MKKRLKKIKIVWMNVDKKMDGRKNKKLNSLHSEKKKSCILKRNIEKKTKNDWIMELWKLKINRLMGEGKSLHWWW